MPSKTTTEYQCDRCGKKESLTAVTFNDSLPTGWVRFYAYYGSKTIYLCEKCFKRAMDPEDKTAHALREWWGVFGPSGMNPIIRDSHKDAVTFCPPGWEVVHVREVVE